jgi:hypothetical protein
MRATHKAANLKALLEALKGNSTENKAGEKRVAAIMAADSPGSRSQNADLQALREPHLGQ